MQIISKLLMVFFIFFALIATKKSQAAVCGEGNVRIGGSVILQDTNSQKMFTLQSSDADLNNNDITIIIQKNSSELWFGETITTPDDKGNYLFFGRCSQSNVSTEPSMSIDGSSRDGNYVLIEPVSIKFTKPKEKVNIMLRSRPNASSAIFNGCDKLITESGSIQKISAQSQETLNVLLKCYKEAENLSSKTVISEAIGDIYDTIGDFQKCQDTFDGLTEIFKEKGERERAEKSLLRSSLCQERMASASMEKREWENLSNYIRKNIKSGIFNRSVKIQLLRIWFDSFVKKISPEGNITYVASYIEENDSTKEEWLEFYYKFYFHGRSNHIPSNYQRETALKELKEISSQYNRTYSASTSSPFVVTPTGRSKVRF